MKVEPRFALEREVAEEISVPVQGVSECWLLKQLGLTTDQVYPLHSEVIGAPKHYGYHNGFFYTAEGVRALVQHFGLEVRVIEEAKPGARRNGVESVTLDTGMLEHANRLLLAAHEMEQRQRLYMEEACAAGIGRWLPWALRARRAAWAAKRLESLSRMAMAAVMWRCP